MRESGIAVVAHRKAVDRKPQQSRWLRNSRASAFKMIRKVEVHCVQPLDHRARDNKPKKTPAHVAGNGLLRTFLKEFSRAAYL